MIRLFILFQKKVEKRDHSEIPHGGFVIRSGKSGWENEHTHIIEYSLKLDSNPEFTSAVLVAYRKSSVSHESGAERMPNSI